MFIELTQCANQQTTELITRFVAPTGQATSKWSAEWFTEEQLTLMKTAIESSDARPVFLRDGIIISDIRAARARGYRALVIIQDKPLVTLLGDTENPTHTQWQRDPSNSN